MVFFKTFEFEFEARRLMWYAPNGGSDFAEVSKTCEKIKEGNYDSWYKEWKTCADQLLIRSKEYSEQISRGQACLRASRYYQAAEFFLHPTDSRKFKAYQDSVDSFYKGLHFLNVPYQLSAVSYDGILLRTVLFKTPKQQYKGTLFVCGGFDALLEELYFTTVKPALLVGYHVVIFEGPGQSDCIRKYGATFTPNWSKVCEVVVEHYDDTLPAPHIGIGLSLGGLLMARAQAQNPNLFDRLVLYNYFPNVLASFKKGMPRLFYRFVDSQVPPLLEKIASFYISKQAFLNWQVEHAKWTFGANRLNQLLATCRDFEELTLKTPTLVCLAKKDNYYDYTLGIDYFNSIQSHQKKLIIFDKSLFSSDLHCQNGASYDTNDEIFDWLSKS